jgi:hypothetical protein
MKRKILIHTASLYYWFTPYEKHLDDRIHTALDAGFDGVEISNGPSILDWTPAAETRTRLKNKTITLHAEIYDTLRLPELVRIIESLPFQIHNVVIHPDELTLDELRVLPCLPFQVSLENLDSRSPQWSTNEELEKHLGGLGLCYDTAHAIETGISFSDFNIIPSETHLSLPNHPDNHYSKFGWDTRHSMTQFEPDKFPAVPSGCPMIVSEGLAPVDTDLLKSELDFIRSCLSDI